jgi:hypothetical protein
MSEAVNCLGSGLGSRKYALLSAYGNLSDEVASRKVLLSPTFMKTETCTGV